MSLEDYARSPFTFRRTDEDIKSLFMWRVITTHINYIDSFRYFLYNDESFKNKNKYFKNVHSNAVSDDQIQWYLIDIISNYIDLLDDELILNERKDTLEKLKDKVKLIKNYKDTSYKNPFYYDKDNKKWIFISTDDDYDYFYNN